MSCFYSNYNNTRPHVTVLFLTLLSSLLLLLLSTFVLLFYLLVDDLFPKALASLYHQVEGFFMNFIISDMVSCLEQAMWFICHVTVPVYEFDKIANIWRIIPICRSSCVSYRKVPSCKFIILDIHVYFDLKRYCGYLDYLDSWFCFNQQNVATTDCLTNFPSKYFYLSIFCLKEIGEKCSFDFLEYHHLNKSLNINIKILFSSFLSSWKTTFLLTTFINMLCFSHMVKTVKLLRLMQAIVWLTQWKIYLR